MDEVFDSIPQGCGLSPLAVRVYTALLNNHDAWVAAGRPPLDPRDLSATETQILLGVRLPDAQTSPGSPSANPASISDPVEPPAPPPAPFKFAKDYRSGDPIPLREALAAAASVRSEDDEDLADDIAGRIAPAENMTLAEWKPLSAVGG